MVFFFLQERCVFSLRQIQLAKHTPSEVIMLAFLCAMLEKFPSDQSSPSKRMNAITSFLEEAVKVVPIESILHAISHDKLDTAVDCANALLNAKPNIPDSHEVEVGMQKAIVRMHTGLIGAEYDEFIKQLLKIPGMSKYSFQFKTTANPRQLLLTCDTPVCIDIPIPVAPLYSRVVRSGLQKTQIVSKMDDVLFNLDSVCCEDTFPEIAKKLSNFAAKNIASLPQKKKKVICDFSIEHVYPVHSARRHSVYHSTLQSPLEVLQKARKDISDLLEDTSEDIDLNNPDTQMSNERMLLLFKDITDHNLKICASLLGSFMEQQIQIPFFKSEASTAYKLSETCSPVAMGAWALFSLSFDKLNQMVAGVHGNPLFVEIADYISLISSSEDLKAISNRSLKYAGKLQFLLQGMKSKTVTCSNNYISYSLEHQLCRNLKFDKNIAIKDLIKDWDEIFKGDALSLVAKSHRSLVARWLKWAVLIHNLRESLAKYTCVGVTGLINSGKSFLVSRLFDIQEVSLFAQAQSHRFM